MTTVFLFPCPDCQQSFNVDVAQAGRTVRCPFCQASTELPKLSKIRQLKPANETSSPSYRAAPNRAMGLAETWMFIIGLPLILLGLGFGTYNYMAASQKQARVDKFDPAKNYEFVASKVDQASMDELWEWWHGEGGIVDRPPEQWSQSGLLLESQRADVGKLLAYILFCVGALGIGLCGYALLMSLITNKKSAVKS